MILETMLQRLFSSLARSPGLDARPHRSRQRLDLGELGALQGTPPETFLPALLGPPQKAIEFPAATPLFVPPAREEEWTPERRAAQTASERQSRLLLKLRDIANDATDYFNDHGENALFLGFPLLSLPPADLQGELRTHRILAPVVLAPIHLRVRHGPRPGVTIEPAARGAEFLVPNPALLAWIEQQTGEDTDGLFADEQADDPWREIADVLALIARATGLDDTAATTFGRLTALQPVPRTEELPAEAALLPCGVLGLFPLANASLLRDTRWMLAHESELRPPVRGFLTTQALATPPQLAAGSPAPDAANAPLDAPAPATPPHLVTDADPCQTTAVAHARETDALVIHGPPGTGKSQTIANIIGDHLARGQRVLFVCDKRTALDVVKHRLDGMGLGVLCGVIHDPQGDRRDFYLGLRERLDGLVEAPLLADPAAELQRVDEALRALRDELRAAFDGLHSAAPGRRSFHDLCGEWLALRAQSDGSLADVEGLTLELLDRHRTDADEILRRAARAHWPRNPFRGRLALGLDAWLATTEGAVRTSLDEIRERAEAVDLTLNPYLPGLAPAAPLKEQAAARRALARAVEELSSHASFAPLAAAIARKGSCDAFAAHHATIASSGALLEVPLDAEILLNLQGNLPPSGDAARGLNALDAWAPLQGSWKRFLAPTRRKEAAAVLAALALAPTPENVERGRAFLRGVRARWLWSDLASRTLEGDPPQQPAPEAALRALRDAAAALVAVAGALKPAFMDMLRPAAFAMLADLAEQAPQFAAELGESADRAAAIDALETAWKSSRLFTDAALATETAAWRDNKRALPLAQSLLGAVATLDDFIRLEDRRKTLPPPLDQALMAAATAGGLWEDVEPSLRAMALGRELRSRLRDDPALARVDTQRVEAAFAELQDRIAQRQELTRAAVLHHWHRLWRERLVASSGSRLNSAAAALRQRLFVRGKRALKLRQMIAAGAAETGGDPLFDLCPVWLASPSTVAQVFPREPIFDVVVFDEASQCRLEEALPVLLRGRRVVIAGDPKQLPPTRFFEQGLAESDEAAAETAEEVFQQQQSEVEDLLTAALNLDVQESYLDVHYRSRHEGLIGFSNDAFYGGRLQPVPGHPRQRTGATPIRLHRVDGVYDQRRNAAEARAVVDLVAQLLAGPQPPSIGVACFNLQQRDLVLDLLEERAEADAEFARRLEEARARRGRDSFEGFFVKNLENVQGDERDHMIVCTTFGPDPEGRFRRNFGALSRLGGERRLNVLVTRAREVVHVITSIPRAEYAAGAAPEATAPTGRHYLYRYLAYAEQLQARFAPGHPTAVARSDAAAALEIGAVAARSPLAEALGRWLHEREHVGGTVHWGNDGFCIDLALRDPLRPQDVTIGVLADFNRYRKTADPIAWELFRTRVLRDQGWQLHRLWTPALFRDPEAQVKTLLARHAALSATSAT